MKPIANFLCLTLLFPAAAASLPAQQAAESPAKPATCPIRHSILANGDIQIQNADCTVKVTPRSAVGVEPQTTSGALIQPTQPAQVEIVTHPAANSAASGANASAAAKAPVHPIDLKPEPLAEGEADPVLRQKYQASMIGYYDYHISGYRHRQRTFEWQFISSIVIFILVVLLVSSGVYFAALQFREGMHHRAAALARLEAGLPPHPLLPGTPADDTVTTFSASSTGISVSSPVLGVIILVISLAFFYLYLVYVYPISELF